MKKILGLYLTATLTFLIWATLSCLVENIVIDLEVENFIKNARFVPEVSDYSNKYYLVEPDEPLDSKCYTKQNGRYYPGGPGDIICAKESAIRTPILGEALTFYTGGHAAISAFNYDDSSFTSREDQVIEVTGFGSRTTVTTESKYQFDALYNEYMAYRVKAPLKDRQRAFARAISYVGEEYNYSFMFELQNKKYCSDLVSRSFDYIGIDLNQDNVATTVLDIMASHNTYLCYYSRVDKNGIRHNFILGDSLE